MSKYDSMVRAGSNFLAATLDIPKRQRFDLRSWYERHFAYYEIQDIEHPIVIAKNLINEKTYVIRVGEYSGLFNKDTIYAGSLVPWNNEWYWSGRQSSFSKQHDNVIQEIKDDLLQNASQVVYRYCDDYAKKSRESIDNHYQNFIKYHGDDLAVFPDGLTMAAEIQKQHRLEYESHPSHIVADVMKKNKLKNPWPNYSYPQELLESENGIGVYFNPDEGGEIMQDFDYVQNGFCKRGKKLTEYENECIREFIYSPSISPQFVNKIIKKYGDESIAEVFLIRDVKTKHSIEYLLRRFKGHFYRKRYPQLSFKAL